MLYRTGQTREAAREIAKVITLGDRDPLYRFHAAAIALANGDRTSAAQHLAIVMSGNPRSAGIDQEELNELRTRLADPGRSKTSFG